MAKTIQMAWGLAAILAVLVLAASWLMFTRYQPYWIAKNDGEYADLRNADLHGACLRGAILSEASLCRAILHGAELIWAIWTKLRTDSSPDCG